MYRINTFYFNRTRLSLTISSYRTYYHAIFIKIVSFRKRKSTMKVCERLEKKKRKESVIKEEENVPTYTYLIKISFNVIGYGQRLY